MSEYVWTGATSSDPSVSTNYSPNGNPANGDSLILDGRAGAAMNGGSALAGVTLALLQISSAFQYTVGAAATPLQVAATIALINTPKDDGTTARGASLIAIDFGSVQTTVSVYGGTNAGVNGMPPILLAGTNASNTLTASGGNIGWATMTPGQSGTLATVSVSGAATVTSTRVLLGSGCTLTTINQSGGSIVVNSAVTTINQTGGTLTTAGTGAIGTATIGGTAVLSSTGTVTTLNVNGKGLADFSQSIAARTVTNASCYGPSCSINANNGANSVTFTNGVACLQGATSNQVNFGGVTVSVG